MRALVSQVKAAPGSLLARLRLASSLLENSETVASPAASYYSSAAPAASVAAAHDEGGAVPGEAPAARNGSGRLAGSTSSSDGSLPESGDVLRDVLQLYRGSLRLQHLHAAIDKLAGHRGDAASQVAAAAVAAAASGPADDRAGAAALTPVANLEARRAQLSAAIRGASSCARVGRLLLGRRHMLTNVHVEQALARMGQLVRQAARQPDEEEQEVFLGVREVLFGMLQQEGSQLSLGAACHLLCASTWMRLPLSPEQQAAVEAVAAPAMPAASAKHAQELLSSYLRLGMRPGQALAAWVAPPSCGPSPPASQSGRVAVALAAPEAAAAAQRRQPRRLTPTHLSAEALERELSRAARRGQHTYMLRLLLHHADQLNSAHLFLALEALAQPPSQSGRAAAGGAAAAAAGGTAGGAAAAAGAPPRPRRPPVLIDTFRAMREVALELLAGERAGREAALGACTLLRASAAMRLRLRPAELAVLEPLAVAGLADASWRDLEGLVLAYAELGLHAGAELQEAAAGAAERLLPAATSRQLRAVLPAWRRCGWPVTPGMASAAELAGLSCLHNAVSAVWIHSPDASSGGGEAQQQRGDPWDGVTPHGQRSLTSLARVAARVCEAFALAEWPLGATLADDLRVALPFCVPAVKLALTGRLLACCLRLGLLPDPGLAAAFLQGSARQLPPAPPDDAAAFAARLLAALDMQGWRYESAPPEQQQAAQLAAAKLAEWLELLHTARKQRIFQDIRDDVARLCRWLHALAAVGLRPPEPTLRSACSYLRYHKRALWRKERQRLAEAFREWQVDDHGLGVLSSGNVDSGGGSQVGSGGDDGSGGGPVGSGGVTVDVRL